MNTGDDMRKQREALNMDRATFGRWLSELAGNDKPYSYQRISDFETGARPIPKDIRLVLLEAENSALKAEIARFKSKN